MVGVAVRTLLAAGYTVTSSRNNPRYVEILCEHVGVLGAVTRVLLALTDEPCFHEYEVADLEYVANKDHLRSLVLVAGESSEKQLCWDDFFECLGGEVPSWQALADTYAESLNAASRNCLPIGESGEAWLLFEDLAADGFGFVLGKRVQRLGGRTRGRAVSDMLAQMPNRKLLVVDTKAYSGGFDVTHSSLRPLGEYVRRQMVRQQGHNEVYAAVMVSSGFHQDQQALDQLSLDFRADYGLPVSFLSAAVLGEMVNALRERVSLRNAVDWQRVFRGGWLDYSHFQTEARKAHEERYSGEVI